MRSQQVTVRVCKRFTLPGSSFHLVVGSLPRLKAAKPTRRPILLYNQLQHVSCSDDTRELLLTPGLNIAEYLDLYQFSRSLDIKRRLNRPWSVPVHTRPHRQGTTRQRRSSTLTHEFGQLATRLLDRHGSSSLAVATDFVNCVSEVCALDWIHVFTGDQLKQQHQSHVMNQGCSHCM